MGDYIGSTIGMFKGDTRSLDWLECGYMAPNIRYAGYNRG